MNTIYFDIFFNFSGSLDELPEGFAIITAYATTGETWSDEENKTADMELKSYLDERFKVVKRISGYSPKTRIN